MNNKMVALAIVLSGILPLKAFPADSDVTLHGTLIETPPCIINNNNIITVDFGEVMTTQVDGVNYKKKVDFVLDCSEGMAIGKNIELAIMGNGAAFDNKLLQTNVDDLGIRFQLDFNINFSINSFNLRIPISNVTDPNPPINIWAVPVQKSGAVLSGGAFRSTASLVIQYQ